MGARHPGAALAPQSGRRLYVAFLPHLSKGEDLERDLRQKPSSAGANERYATNRRMTRSVPPLPGAGNGIESPGLERHTLGPDTLVCNLAPAPVVLKRAEVERAGASAALAEAAGRNAASPTQPSPSDTPAATKNRWLSLGLICICSLMMVLD